MRVARAVPARPAVLKPRAKPLPRTLKLNFNHLPAQTKAYRAFQPGCRVAIPWGRGCGKSWFVRRMAYLLVAQWDGQFRPDAPHTGVRIVVLMPTLEQARKVHADLLLTELDEHGEWGFLGAKVNKSTWRVTFPGGSWIQFVTAERAQHIRGIRCDAAFVDEADDIDPDLIGSVVNPWFSEPHSLAMMLVAGTPRRGRGGLLWEAYHDWPKRQPGRYFGFHATAYQADRRIIDRAYLDEVRSITVEEIFKREWLCDFDAAEGLVYPQFMASFHVREPPDDVLWSEILVGGDHGYEDPGVLLKIGILGHGADATAWILEEVYERHRDPEWWLDVVTEWVADYPAAKWYADPALPGVLRSWKKRGANIKDVDKGAGSVENGVKALQRWLHVRRRRNDEGVVTRESARLYVHPRCVNTIAEFALYRRKRSRQNTETVLEEIEDRNNHAMDSLRYAICSRFEQVTGRKRDANADNRPQ